MILFENKDVPTFMISSSPGGSTTSPADRREHDGSARGMDGPRLPQRAGDGLQHLPGQRAHGDGPQHPRVLRHRRPQTLYHLQVQGEDIR